MDPFVAEIRIFPFNFAPISSARSALSSPCGATNVGNKGANAAIFAFSIFNRARANLQSGSFFRRRGVDSRDEGKVGAKEPREEPHR